ncbi:tRNA1(Val) (adenine(37)-N6)-methyltransferase [Arsenicitalea aurantiaca]|uniref:tRNA1(Val) (adenine(37)-N6)-methyltransferase n=1 Tax=Arsenicitalea aurantiaca TaxID=1783274 RepID=UPI001315A39D|nr:methyltransferase [Arsenicitalea aurantiaca]
MSQPAAGFRAGLDSVLLGASVGEGRKSLLELGAGVGTAALVAMAHNPDLDAVLLERDAATAALATDNVARNGFNARARVLCLDVTAPGSSRLAAGVMADAYGSVIANPPYYGSGEGSSAPHPGRAAARHMDADQLDLWVRAAATSVAPRGEVIFIHRAESLPPLLGAFDRRFGGITVLPLAPRPGRPATRILIRALKGSRAPMTLLATRALHAVEGRGFAPEFEAIFRGSARLDW